MDRQRPTTAPAQRLDGLERRLLNEYQRGFPLVPRPYARLAADLGVSEARVMRALESLARRGMVSRVGPVFRPRRTGASTLAAMAVPPQRLEAVAALVSACPEVNHNYEREHRLNLWFVVTAADGAAVDRVLESIGRRTGIEVLDLPMERDFHIDLGFALWC